MITNNNKHKIHVAQVITRMDWGGSPDILRILCQRLDKEKFEVSLVTGKSRNLTKKTEKFYENFYSNVFSLDYLRRDINPFFDLIAFVQLFLFFKINKFDVVHTHTAKAGALGRLAAKLAGVKTIIHTSHGHNFYGYFGPLMSGFIVRVEKFLSSFTNKIITLTKTERTDLLKFNICKEEKIEVIHTILEMSAEHISNTIENIEMKKSLGIEEQVKIVGMVGRLEEIKGVDFFVEAAISILRTNEDVVFLIVGEGSLKAKLQERVKSAAFEDRMKFLSWQENPVKMMSIMDILVLASLNEAVGIVLLEAQYLGIPVVASCVGGIPEIVEDGKSGYLVEPSNEKVLAQAIEVLLYDEQKRHEMGAYAKNFVKGKYDAQDFVDSVSQIYTNCTRIDTNR